MNDELKILLSFVGIGVAVVFFYLFLSLSVLKKRAKAKADKKAQLLNLYSHEGVYLCDSAEDLGQNLIQFYGEPHGTSVRPGMTIIDPGGVSHVVKEVYSSDTTNDPHLDQPDPEIPNGMTNTAVVIETKSFNWPAFQQQRKNGGGYVALKIR